MRCIGWPDETPPNNNIRRTTSIPVSYTATGYNIHTKQSSCTLQLQQPLRTYPKTNHSATQPSTMAITHGDRVLRLITVLTWVPAMTLLIIFGVKSNQAIPPLGLIPMTFSAVFGLFKIYSHAKNHGFTIFMDTSLAIFIFALFTPGIVLVRQYSHWWIGSAVENAILGTFGLSTLLINL